MVLFVLQNAVGLEMIIELYIHGEIKKKKIIRFNSTAVRTRLVKKGKLDVIAFFSDIVLGDRHSGKGNPVSFSLRVLKNHLGINMS